MLTRFRLLASWACLALTTVCAAAPTTIHVTADLDITQLRAGVWMHTSWNTYENTRVPSNGLLVREGEGLVLVDTAWGVQPTIDLLDWVERELRRPITRAIVTHSHADRLGGGAALAARGIPFDGHPVTATLAAKGNLPAPRSLESLALPGGHTTLGTVEVFFPGPGHTVDNITVWIPAEKILVGGCAVKSVDSENLGYVAEADLGAWPASIRRLQARYSGPDVFVIPGHGEPGDSSLLQHTLDLLERR
ncbi:MAG: subclass B1 metallo-beta-lactamase [Opitutaceae bacterium]|nr:subclass B1 metallo-beta-lactamase [Opitutaceae bacterium]